MPMLALLLLLSVFCSNALRAACKRMSPSALSTALLPADRFDPVTLMSESLPAPWATMVRSLPAATVEPKALDELRSVVLLLLLVPRLSLMLTPPALSSALDEPGLTASAAAAAFADACTAS
ncbi:hypothetical protein D3C85_732930 [compost metagenome]